MTGQTKDVELDESGFGAKLKELEDKGFHTDSAARVLDDDGDPTAFDDGADILAETDLDGQAARPEAGRVPDAPGDDDPIPDPPLEPLLPFDGNPPIGGADDFFETLGGIPEPEDDPISPDDPAPSQPEPDTAEADVTISPDDPAPADEPTEA